MPIILCDVEKIQRLTHVAWAVCWTLVEKEETDGFQFLLRHPFLVVFKLTSAKDKGLQVRILKETVLTKQATLQKN